MLLETWDGGNRGQDNDEPLLDALGRGGVWTGKSACLMYNDGTRVGACHLIYV